MPRSTIDWKTDLEVLHKDFIPITFSLIGTKFISISKTGYLANVRMDSWEII